MWGILVWFGRLYTGFTLSSNGYFASGCVISVKFNFPIFTILLSVLQWTCYHVSTIYTNNGFISESDFEANHLKRQQIWRQFSYLFCHDDERHLWGIINNQLLIGCCLEIINGWKPVLLIYFGGAFVSDMIDFFAGSSIKGSGAFGAVTALNAAYLATVILNWKEISFAVIRTLYLLYFTVGTFGMPPFWYPIAVALFGPIIRSPVSNASSVGGALGGFIFGMSLVKVFRTRLWKVELQRNYGYAAIMLMALVAFSIFCDPFVYSSVLHDNDMMKELAMRDLMSPKSC